MENSVERFSRRAHIAASDVHQRQRVTDESVGTKPKLYNVAVDLRSGSEVPQAGARLEDVGEGVVVREEAVTQQAAIDLEGVRVVLSQQEGLDHGVADAKRRAVDVPEEEMRVAEAAVGGVGADGQEAAEKEGVLGEAGGDDLSLGLFQLPHVLALLQQLQQKAVPTAA